MIVLFVKEIIFTIFIKRNDFPTIAQSFLIKNARPDLHTAFPKFPSLSSSHCFCSGCNIIFFDLKIIFYFTFAISKCELFASNNTQQRFTSQCIIKHLSEYINMIRKRHELFAEKILKLEYKAIFKRKCEIAKRALLMK